MRTSTTVRRIATTLIATASLVGIAGTAATAAHAAPGDKELVYRGSGPGNGLVMTANNANGSPVFLASDTNSPKGQWRQVSTVSSGGGQPSFLYQLRASVDAGNPLCLTAVNSVNVAMRPCDIASDRQKWFHPNAVVGPNGNLPTKNVHTGFHLGQNGALSSVTLSQSVQISGHFWSKRTV